MSGTPAVEVTEAMALGVANLVRLFSLEVIVIGSGIGRTGDQLRSSSGRPPLGDNACLFGAAAWPQTFNSDAAGRHEPEPDMRGSGVRTPEWAVDEHHARAAAGA